MKILFLTGCINQIGGIERVALDVIKILKSAEHEISVISYSKAPGDGFPGLSEINAVYLNEKPVSVRYSFLKAGKLRKIIRQTDPDFIVYVDSFLYFFFRPFVPKKYKQIVWEHFNYTTTFGTRFRTWSRKYAAATADACVLSSVGSRRRDVEEELPVQSRNQSHSESRAGGRFGCVERERERERIVY